MEFGIVHNFYALWQVVLVVSWEHDMFHTKSAVFTAPKRKEVYTDHQPARMVTKHSVLTWLTAQETALTNFETNSHSIRLSSDRRASTRKASVFHP
jgi:hypothetical protein